MIDSAPYKAWFENMDKWKIADKDGYPIGIKPDAPDDVREAYEAFRAEYDKAFKEGILL